MGYQDLQWDIHVPLQAAGTDRTVFRTFKAEGNWFIESAEFMPDDAITAAATNYVTVTLTNVTDSATIHTFNTNTGQTTTVAGTAIAVTVDAGSDSVVTQGDKFSLAKVETGTGGALGGTYSLFLRRRAL